MKKLFLFVSLFAALSTGVYADDIWGNEDNEEQNADDALGTTTWLMRSRPTSDNWAGNETSGETAPNKNEIPVGEGALVLLIGGGLYAISKLRRK